MTFAHTVRTILLTLILGGMVLGISIPTTTQAMPTSALTSTSNQIESFPPVFLGEGTSEAAAIEDALESLAAFEASSGYSCISRNVRVVGSFPNFLAIVEVLCR